MSRAADSWVARGLRGLARAVCARPRWFLFPQLLLLGVSILYTVRNLEFDTNRDNLVASDSQSRRDYLRFMEEFNAQSELVAVIESEDTEKNRQFVERLGRRMEAETNLFSDVFYKGDLSMMGPKALQFVEDVSILDEMADRLEAARPVLQKFSQVTNLTSLFRLVVREFRGADRSGEGDAEAMISALPALTRIADQARDALTRPGVPPSPGVAALFEGEGGDAESSLYITFASNRLYVVTARPKNSDVSEAAVRRFQELIQATRAEVPGVNAGITGEPVLEVDEMAQSQQDMTAATVLALVLCGLLFIYGYRETGRPLKAMACLVVGLGYTLGFATLTIGHLNLLTITFLPILIGLAIDFGIHLVTRYEEELHQGRTEQEAITAAMVHTGQGIFTGALTTAAAFFAMGLADFKGIREMGIISGGGLLISLAPMMTLLPVLLLRGRQNLLDHLPQRGRERRARLERLWMERPVWVIGAAVAATGLSLWQFPRVIFDYNLLHLQSRGLPAVEYEHKLIRADARSVLFGAVIVDSIQEARAKEAALRKLPTVASVDSVTAFLGGDQSAKLAAIRKVKSKLAGIQFAEPDLDPVDVGELRMALRDIQAYFGLGASFSAAEGAGDIAAELTRAKEAFQRLRLRLAETDHETAQRKLGQFQRALLNDLKSTFDAIAGQDDVSPLRIEDIPLPLRNRFVSRSGDAYLLMVSSTLDLWERDNQERFLNEVRTVAPNVTGTPVQLLEYTTQLKNSYIEAAWYAFGAIALMVWIHFRSPLSVALALLPVALGMVWLGGWMGWQGLPFNPANIMTLPLVIGVGVTNGIHILNRCAEERDPCILARSTGKAVLLSALTTILGFGSLMVAKHQGIASLGELMAVGTATCMVAGLAFLPTLLGWLGRLGWHVPGGKTAHADDAAVPPHA